MNPWIEIYDNEQVQWHLRRRVRNLGAFLVVYVSLAVVLCAVSVMDAVPNRLLPVGAAILFLGAASWTATRILGLRNQVWCVKLSPHMIRGYDYRRTPTTISWSDVIALDVTATKISIFCGSGQPLEIPSLFPDFAYVSHRLLDLTELHRVPVYIDGLDLVNTDLFTLLPELRQIFAEPTVAGSASA